jgi:hypothetical protein
MSLLKKPTTKVAPVRVPGESRLFSKIASFYNTESAGLSSIFSIALPGGPSNPESGKNLSGPALT